MFTEVITDSIRSELDKKGVIVSAIAIKMTKDRQDVEYLKISLYSYDIGENVLYLIRNILSDLEDKYSFSFLEMLIEI